MVDRESAWREQRRLAAAAHAAADERSRGAEAEAARQLLAEFVRAAQARGLRAVQLAAQAYDGRARYRTGLRGWYLKRDRSVAAGIDGALYLLSVPPAFRARFTGVTLTAATPRLVVGQGGRDGESIPLATLLARRLDAGDHWP
jgi:hypothetical protein